jgi:hypothetical protein
MREFLEQLGQAIVGMRLQASGYEEREEGEMTDDEHGEKDEDVVEEVSESLDTRPHRRSIVTGLDPLGVMTEPLSPVKLRMEDSSETDDGFS